MSLAACSRIRAGTETPHPRHWNALLTLIVESPNASRPSATGRRLSVLRGGDSWGHWAHEHPGQRDEAWFKREVALKLDGFSLKEIGKATGLSLATCSRIRAGTKIPHPRLWDSLCELEES
ncbi:MAG: helix-turn-helix transcriptional regulator [Candidatus Cybelea sp.]